MPNLSFTLNGKRTTCSYEPGMHFLEVLREECGIETVERSIDRTELSLADEVFLAGRGVQIVSVTGEQSA